MDRSSGVLRRCTWRRRGIGYGDQRAVDVSGREGGFEPAISRSRTECPTGLSSVLPNDGPALHCVATLSRPRSSSCHRGADLARTSSKPRHHRQTATEQATELGFGRCPQILREWVQIWVQSRRLLKRSNQPPTQKNPENRRGSLDQQPSGNS